MANLARWDPYADTMGLREALDQLFQNALIGFGPWQGSGGQLRSNTAFPIDLTENDDSFVVKASLLGLDPNDLEVRVQDNVLTIQGEMKSEEEKKDERYHLRERRWGTFARIIALPSNVDSSKVQAEYENGVFFLTLPKTEEAKPRRIQIKGGEQGKQLEGQASAVNVKSQ
jgi:HSP20 family protein